MYAILKDEYSSVHLKNKYSSVHLKYREKVVQLLVDRGADVNTQDQVIIVTKIA